MLKKIVPDSEFGKNILTLTSGSAIAQAIPILATLVLSRIYLPADFGEFAEFMGLALILAVLATGRYELALILPKEDSDAINLFGLVLLISSSFCLLLLLLIPLADPVLTNFNVPKGIKDHLIYVPIMVFMIAINQLFNSWFNRKKKYEGLSYNRITLSSTTAGSKILYGLLYRVEALGLIVGNAIGYLCSIILFTIRLLKGDRMLLKSIERRRMVELSKRYEKFPKFDMSSGVLYTVSSQIPVLMLGAYFNVAVVGWFSIANTVLRMPMAFVGSAVGQVFFQHSSELREDMDRLRDTTFKLYKKLFLVGILPMSIVGAFGDILFYYILGPNWLEAGRYAQLLAPWLMMVFMMAPVSHLLNVLEKQQSNLMFNSFGIVMRIVAILIGALLFNDAWITVWIYAAVSFVLWFGFTLYILKLVGLSPIKLASYTLIRFIVAAALCVGLRWLFDIFVNLGI